MLRAGRGAGGPIGTRRIGLGSVFKPARGALYCTGARALGRFFKQVEMLVINQIQGGLN